MAKQVTRDQAERKQRQAVTLLERIGDTDRAAARRYVIQGQP
jgi:hypothetical protein